MQLDQVLARYANSAAAAADTVDAARQKLSASVEAAAQADQDQINLYQQIADSLTAYLDQLREQSLAAGPGTLGAASSLFGQTAALAQAGDAVAGGKLQGVAEAFRTANAGQAKSAVELARNEALIRIGVEKAAETAKREVSVAEQQLEELHTQTDALLEIDRSVLSVVDAIEALNLALTEQAAGATGAPPITTAVPAAPPSVTTLDSTSPPITPATAIDPATIAPSLNGADVAASLMRQSSLLEQVAIASGVTAATLKFFNRVGMPDVRPA